MEKKSENKICQNCKSEFIIEPEDFEFYEKMKVPPPTWCPDCRTQRRFLWRNEWILFKKRDEHTGKDIFSLFPPDSPVKIYEKDYWFSDAWEPMDYGREYDWSSPFFSQIADLLHEVPLPARSILNFVNSDYSMNAGFLKNCYMVFNADYVEDSAYLVAAAHSKDCFDCHIVQKSELCYESVNLVRCYKTFYSINCEDCQEVIFSKDCIGCSNCFGCVNLRKKSYHIFNKPYSKEDYTKKIQEFDLVSRSGVEVSKKKALSFLTLFPNKFMKGRHNVDVSGDYITNSKNAIDCYRVDDVEDLKHCQFILLGPAKDCQDFSIWGQGSELIYESVVAGNGVNNQKFCWQSFSENRNLEYCISCHNSSDLFACVGLRNKQFCIFNKQYTKEEYEKLVPKIIEHMNDMPYKDNKGRIYKYGEFFPSDLSPFAYNETIAQEYFPLTKEEAIEKGYSWRDLEKKDYKITRKSEDLPGNIKDVDDSILDEIIGCEHEGKCNERCTTAFKIIKPELEFYKKMNIPLPKLCPNCRHYGRIKQRNPLKLWHRKCQCAGTHSDNKVYENTVEHPHHGKDHCPNEFETTYSPDKKEIVYCEKCYQGEVV